MNKLSLDELLLVAQKLTLAEYHLLRFALTTDLPLIPTINPEQFFLSIKDSRKQYWNYVNLNTEQILNWNLLGFRLTQKYQLPAIKSYFYKISQSGKMNIIRYGCGDITSIMLLQSMSQDLPEALSICCRFGYLQAAQYLLDIHVDATWDNNEPIRAAAHYNHLEIVQMLLLDLRVDPADNNNELLQDAATEGRYEIVELMMKDSRIDPSFPENHVIFTAALKRNFKIVNLLLNDIRVDPSTHNNFLIITAATFGKYELVHRLMNDPRVTPSAQNSEALVNAAKYGYEKIVELLLTDPSMDPSAMRNEAFVAASGDGYIEIVKMLVEDARFKLGPCDFDNASDSALFFGHADVVQYLRVRFGKNKLHLLL
ncbi:hypothetical protein HDV01_002363 [Terramyces sp. JEL0728]|nr:hypothetical protein HDV01_002363 [Terramyces sp. JEL0728]